MGVIAGYHFDGWYTATSGGSKVMEPDGTLVASVTNYTNASRKWAKAGNATLYAQYIPASLAASSFYLQSNWSTPIVAVAPSSAMGAMANFEVTPGGTGGTDYIISWRLLSISDIEEDPQPAFSYTGLTDAYKKVKFTAPSTSGSSRSSRGSPARSRSPNARCSS